MRFWHQLFGSKRKAEKPSDADVDTGWPDPFVGVSKDELSKIALRKIGTMRFHCRYSSSGGTVEDCDLKLHDLRKMRAMNEAGNSPRFKAAVEQWLSYYERQILLAREDCVTQKSRLQHEALSAEMSASSAAIDAAESSLDETALREIEKLFGDSCQRPERPLTDRISLSCP